MRRTAVRIITVGMLVASTVAAGASGAQTSSPAPDRALVTAIGRGEVHVVPDRALVMISVETRDSSARAAGSENARQTSATLAALHAVGIVDSAIVTSGYTVSIDYRTLPPAVGTSTGPARAPTFVARNTMRVTLAPLSSVGRVLDAALAGGATQVGPVVFTSSRMEEARRAALTQAVEHARVDAETTARALGRSLGDLAEVTTQGALAPSVPMYEMMAGPVVAGGVSRPVMSAPVPPTALAPGDVVVGETVVVRWRLVPRS